MKEDNKPKWIRNAQGLFKKSQIIKYSVIDHDEHGNYIEYEVDENGKRKKPKTF